jgi:hypothetical protein
MLDINDLELARIGTQQLHLNSGHRVLNHLGSYQASQ